MSKLKKLRGDRFTQATLAKRIGVSLRTYKNYEAGRTKPGYEKSKALAEALGTTMDKLF